MTLQRFHKVLECSGVPSEEISIITNSIDPKSSGAIDLEDFLDFLGYDPEEQGMLTAQDKMVEALQSEEGKADLRKFFDSIDKDKNGKVSSKEWGHALGKNKEIMAKYFGGATPAEIGQAFKRIDKNKDGDLSWEEFVAAAESRIAQVETGKAKLAEAMQTPAGQEELKAFFTGLDKDGNGKVDSKEWGHALGKHQGMMMKYFGGLTPAEIGQAFKRIDVNGDGSLSWEEFVAAANAAGAKLEASANALAVAMQSDESKAALKEFFDKLDKDGNGKVDSKEWGKALGKNKEIMAKFFGGSTPAEIGQAFKRIDTNGDGVLSWEEFVAASELRAGKK